MTVSLNRFVEQLPRVRERGDRDERADDDEEGAGIQITGKTSTSSTMMPTIL
jgi:hypothetical protein